MYLLKYTFVIFLFMSFQIFSFHEHCPSHCRLQLPLFLKIHIRTQAINDIVVYVDSSHTEKVNKPFQFVYH